jgi:phage terminase large subunit-like protein
MMALVFEDFGLLAGAPTRRMILHQAIDFGTRSFAPAADDTRIDPLFRLFDPEFAERTWYHDNSKIGDLPGTLHAKQLEALVSPAVHRWLFWGNQVGKTTLGAVDMALCALGRHPLQKSGYLPMPPFTGWASALTWELWEKILLPELLSWLPPWRVLDAPPAHRQSTKRDIVILADNGRESRITGKAAEQGAARYQSARVNLIWLDEEHPEDVWNEMQPRLLRFGGRTLATMTPLKGLTWVHGRVYEPTKASGGERVERNGITVPRHWYSHAGLRDNPGISPEARQEMLDELKHNPAQLAARDEGLFVRPEGAVLPWDAETHLVDVDAGRLAQLRSRGAWYGALDLGKWRFAFSFGVADADRNFLLLDEYFNQKGNADDAPDLRAKGIHDLLRKWDVPDSIMIPADCADPKGIIELNEAFERLGSPYYVYPIPGELKAVQAGIDRCESMLNRGAFKVRRGMGADMTWNVHKNASSPGRPIMGSRWMWEAVNWLYPKTAEGKVQKDEPDDASADGADMMDTFRYMMTSFFAADAPPQSKRNPTRLEQIQAEINRMKERDDEWEEQHRGGGERPYGGVLRQ